VPTLPSSPQRPWVPKREPRAYVKPQTEGAGFYQSKEWKEARTECVKRAGKKCAICDRTGWIADHIKPIRLGGEKLSQANLQCVCPSCHAKKSAKERHIATP